MQLKQIDNEWVIECDSSDEEEYLKSLVDVNQYVTVAIDFSESMLLSSSEHLQCI